MGIKEFWLIDLETNKALNYCKAKNKREAEKIFMAEAEVENYNLSNCALVSVLTYYN